jgi:hypothetical protein
MMLRFMMQTTMNLLTLAKTSFVGANVFLQDERQEVEELIL